MPYECKRGASSFQVCVHLPLCVRSIIHFPFDHHHLNCKLNKIFVFIVIAPIFHTAKIHQQSNKSNPTAYYSRSFHPSCNKHQLTNLFPVQFKLTGRKFHFPSCALILKAFVLCVCKSWLVMF